MMKNTETFLYVFLTMGYILSSASGQSTTRLLQDLRDDIKSLENTLLEGKNLAYGKKCGTGSWYGSVPPESAVDGYLTTYQRTAPEDKPYWWVDLGGSYYVTRIDIYNADITRGNYGYRLHDLEVTVGPDLQHMSLCRRFTGPGTDGQHIVLKCPLNLKGQYVKLQMTKGYANVLHVSEVKVYGHK